MRTFNRVQIIGYQTQPVEVRQTPGGTSVTDLNLVVPYSFKTQEGTTLEGKSFHTVTLWGPMADIAGQYLRAGSQVFVSGRLQTDSWEDTQTQEKRSKTKIVGMDMIMLDPKDGPLPALAEGSTIATGLNRADIVGNVTRDPELRTTTNGQQVLTLGVATNDRWKDKASGEDRERAEFHSIVIWGDLAEEVNRTMKKGSRVFVTGRVQSRSWETQSGSKRTATEIIADSITLLGTEHEAAKAAMSRSEQGSAAAPASPPPPESATPDAPVPEADAVPAGDIPDIAYKSEVKAEDLPF